MPGIVILAAAYVLSQFYRSFLAVLTIPLGADIGATKADLSLASGAWFAAFAIMQFAVGVALDRFGPRLTTSLILAVGGAGGAFLFAQAQTPATVVIAMALIGAGCSPVLMAAFYIFAREYEPARFATLGSIFIAVGLAGNVLGASPLASAAEAFGWRAVMVALALATLLGAAAVFMLVRDPPAAGTSRADNGVFGYLDLLSIRAIWPIIPLTIVAYSVPAGIRGLWAGPYLAEVHGADTLAIGNATFWMAVAMVAGTVAYGPSDRILNTRKWIVVPGIAMVVFALVALAGIGQVSQRLATTLIVIVGFFGANYAVMMTHARAYYPAHLTGRGVTLMNFFSIGGVGLMQWLTGRLVAGQGEPPAAAYAMLFGFYAAVLSAALLIYLFSRDAKPGAAQA